jgi:hypothetical protein
MESRNCKSFDFALFEIFANLKCTSGFGRVGFRLALKSGAESPFENFEKD